MFAVYDLKMLARCVRSFSCEWWNVSLAQSAAEQVVPPCSYGNGSDTTMEQWGYPPPHSTAGSPSSLLPLSQPTASSVAVTQQHSQRYCSVTSVTSLHRWNAINAICTVTDTHEIKVSLPIMGPWRYFADALKQS